MPSKNDKSLTPILTQAGIKRDGTSLDGNFYSDGLWCRFRNGRPKKIGGYRQIINLDFGGAALNSPVRAISTYPKSPMVYTYLFHGQGVTVVPTDHNGVGAAQIDRTPAAFPSSTQLAWQVDYLYDSTGTPNTMVLAHASQTLYPSNMSADISLPFYYGIANDATVPALANGGVSVSGGLVVLQPFLFLYGSNGLIKNSDANKPLVFTGGFSNEANVAGTKIVKGLPLRGGGNSPAGLFWSLDSLIRVTFTPGGTTNWRYDTLAKTTVLSPNAIIEYDGVYYWPGVDRFLLFNGVVKELPNPLNQDFFFDNIQQEYREKVWAMAIPRWGEIWWFFPKYPATECNWAVIYNVREGSWYDTPIARSAGCSPGILTFPVCADSNVNVDLGHNAYRVFKHEAGVDKVVDDSQTAIESMFETSDIGFATGGNGANAVENMNVQTLIKCFEPDFVQTGELSLVVTGTAYAEDTEVMDSIPSTFEPEEAGTKVDLKEQRRILRLRVTSNVLGGDYMMGKSLVHLEPGDERP